MWKSRRERREAFNCFNPQPPAPVVPAPTQSPIPHRGDAKNGYLSHRCCPHRKICHHPGELSGSEDLTLMARLEGNIDCTITTW